MKIRIIGDIHGNYTYYAHTIKYADYSLQVGDFGFNHAWSKLLANNVDPKNHKIVLGNHDDYDFIREQKIPNALDGYGYDMIGDLPFFYVKGSRSIDKEWRTPGIDWWDAEELTYRESVDALNLYEKIKPDVMVTHTVPGDAFHTLFPLKELYNSTTAQVLSDMLMIHNPKLWIFGDMHPRRTFMWRVANTQFLCIAIDDYIEYDTEKSVEANIEIYDEIL